MSKIPQESILQITFYEGFGAPLLHKNVRFYAGFEGFAGATKYLYINLMRLNNIFKETSK
jgi:hypothetical protein